MIPRIPVEDEHSDEPASRPVWKRPRVIMAAAIVVAVVAFVLSPAGKNASHRGNTGGSKDAFIGQIAACCAPRHGNTNNANDTGGYACRHAAAAAINARDDESQRTTDSLPSKDACVCLAATREGGAAD